MNRRFLAAAAVVLIVGCGSPPTTPAAPAVPADTASQPPTSATPIVTPAPTPTPTETKELTRKDVEELYVDRVQSLLIELGTSRAAPKSQLRLDAKDKKFLVRFGYLACNYLDTGITAKELTKMSVAMASKDGFGPKTKFRMLMATYVDPAEEMLCPMGQPGED